MGLNKDLKLKGNNFSNAATAFFIAYLIAEIPNGRSFQSHGLHMHLTQCSYRSAEGPRCEMARSQCHLVGNCNGMHRSSARLSLSISRPDLSGNI